MSVHTHVERHRDSYEQIASQLEAVRHAFESAPPAVQNSMLLDSTVYAVMSVQNSVDVLDRAFRAYSRIETDTLVGSDELQSVAQHLNYGQNKRRYIEHNAELISGDVGDRIVTQLTADEGSVWTAIETIQADCLGVSWIKAAFVPAMLGYTDAMCIDTNVAQMVSAEHVVATGYSNGDDYREAVEAVMNHYPDVADE